MTWGEVRGRQIAAPTRYNATLFHLFVGRDILDAPNHTVRLTPIRRLAPPPSPVILKPQAEESVGSLAEGAVPWWKRLGETDASLPPSMPRKNRCNARCSAPQTFPRQEGPQGRIFLAKQEFFLYFAARI